MRDASKAKGRTFSSETDTEIIAHLVDEEIKADKAAPLVEQVRRALKQVQGAYAIVVLSDTAPDQIIAAKNASPLVLGLGEGENFVASDVPAILAHTRRMIFLEEGEIAEVKQSGIDITDLEGNTIEREPKEITWSVGVGGEGRLQALHAQGDPRAGARRDRHAARALVGRA